MRKHQTYQDIMNGLSHMVPFVIAGSILIGLSMLLGGPFLDAFDFKADITAWLKDTGELMYTLIFPVFAGFIAYSIADRPGLVPGFLAGAIAYTSNTYFLGALLGGLIAGYSMVLIKYLLRKTPKSTIGLKTMLVFPVIGTLLTAILMIPLVVLISPVSLYLQNWTQNMSLILMIGLGFIAGGLMAYDFGGPVNKIVYLIGVATISLGNSSTLMASIMVGGMIPPLAIALAVLISKNKFSSEEIKLSQQNWILGLSFMTEGAIPFVQNQPKKIVVSMMMGSAIAGAIVGLFQTSIMIPHGGIFVLFMMHQWWGFLVALVIGTITGALLFVVFRNKLEDPKSELNSV